MKIKLIDFGLEKDHYPFRPHENDAGADVYMPYDCTLKPGEIARIPLGFGLMIPDGYAGYVFPRSSMAAKGLVCELPPIDSGYRGEIHAIISNVTVKPLTFRMEKSANYPYHLLRMIYSFYIYAGTASFGGSHPNAFNFFKYAWIFRSALN